MCTQMAFFSPASNQVFISRCFTSVIKSSWLLLPSLLLYSGIKAIQKIETSISCNPIGFRGRIIYVQGIGRCVLHSWSNISVSLFPLCYFLPSFHCHIPPCLTNSVRHAPVITARPLCRTPPFESCNYRWWQFSSLAMTLTAGGRVTGLYSQQQFCYWSHYWATLCEWLQVGGGGEVCYYLKPIAESSLNRKSFERKGLRARQIHRRVRKSSSLLKEFVLRIPKIGDKISRQLIYLLIIG